MTSPPVDPVDDPQLRVGRFAGQLYGIVGLLGAAWAVGSGAPWDWWMVTFVGACAAATAISRLPWGGRGDLLATFLVAAAGVLILLYIPLFMRAPGLLVSPAVAAAYAGAAVDKRWLASLVPAAGLLAVLLAAEDGTRAGWSEAGLYLGLWLTVGSVSVWMRNEVEVSNRALVEAQQAVAEQAALDARRRAEEAAAVERELRQRVEVAGSLRGLVESVRSSSDQVEAQSANIATAVEQLAGGLQETSSTSVAAEEIVRRIASATVESQEMISQLGSAGQQIVGIVDTIADLSEQTNLLALNAAIEAARAGEAGNGFAVVASEVKDLAQQTAKSASGIGDVIDQVHDRLSESARAMGAMAELVDELERSQSVLGHSVAEQTAVVGDISRAAKTGAEGMADIGQAIRRLDEHAAGLVGDETTGTDRAEIPVGQTT